MASHEPPVFAIPTIDLSAYLHRPNSSDAANVVEQIRTACATSGFFQLIGHGVPESLQRQAFEAARMFFALPDDEKRNLSGKPGRGYELIGTQILEDGKQPDLKEVSLSFSPVILDMKPYAVDMISLWLTNSPRATSLAARLLTKNHHIGHSKSLTSGLVQTSFPTRSLRLRCSSITKHCQSYLWWLCGF